MKMPHYSERENTLEPWPTSHQEHPHKEHGGWNTSGRVIHLYPYRPAPFDSYSHGYPSVPSNYGNHWMSGPYPDRPATSGYYPPSHNGAQGRSPPFAPPQPLIKSTQDQSNRKPPSVIYIQPPQSRGDGLIHEISDNDVLCGRGAPTTWHPGNQYFRRLVDEYQHDYLAARRIDKPDIACRITQLIRGSGGRFLKRTKVNGPGSRGHFCWEEISEQRAYEKTCQALREGAPEIRRQLAAREMAAITSESRNEASSGSPGTHFTDDLRI